MIYRIMIAVLILCVASSAQTIHPEAQKKVEKFYNQVKSGEYRTALEDITKGGPLYTKIFGDEATAISFVKKLESLQDYYGSVFGYEMAKDNALGRIFKYTYFFYHEKYATRFIFTFYMAEDEWTLIYFEFDDSILLEIN